MKERGIIFNGDMVRAILSGQKTQTRRIVRPQPDEDGLARLSGGPWMDTSEKVYRCPFGEVGDRLWVRETFADVNTENGPAFTYRADDGLKFCLDDESPVNYDRYPGKNFAMWCGDLWRGEDGHVWTPSIHMARWASRITLEITGVRVERLNDISQEDAQAEGMELTGWRPTYSDPDSGGEVCTPYDNFAELWQSIYGAESWDANPWCWAITFKRIEVA